jgi:PadR family transcriptional regulator PadR
MPRNRPPSPQAINLLFKLAEDANAWRHGYDLCQTTGLKAGSLYPILMRLADRGWLEAKWETEIPAGRPPRHLYRLTTLGRREVRELAKTRKKLEAPRAAWPRPQREGQ